MAGLGEEKQKQKTTTTTTTAPLLLPRVRILYCEQCKWMLRAAYFAQELLSTFSTSIGEVALVPSTGGVFVIDITHVVVSTDTNDRDDSTSTQSGGGGGGGTVLSNIQSTKQITTRLWDRKVDGGFPETKTLKKLIRDIIDPSRDLGHVDGHKKTAVTNANPTPTPTPNPGNNSNNDNNDNDNINTDDIGKKESSGRAAHDVVLVIADQDPILSSTGQEEEEGEEKEGGGGEGERDSSNQQQILDREDDDDVANKSGQQGVVAMKESDQKEKVCDDCA